jgi:predicted Fe-Mo cluster-binding NifX family protein
MKITFGADGNTLDSKVSKRFGHAEYYVIYDADTQKIKAIKNIDDNHTHSVLYELLDKGTEVFIVGNIGPHAFEIVKTENTKIFLSRNKTLQEALDLFIANELEELEEPTVKKSINHHH